ncbi:rhodanese-like domain-containing protein [Actinoplanes sp. NPDC051851]|uniref:sulfurtransferase n=1 Tax=Actinoplanes sp. NPDC051851 TaxID=3154753 RepID=UPI003446EA13
MTGPLVSAAWLADHLGEVTVLDASIHRTATGFAPGREAFAAGHIPSARFADLVTDFSDPDAPFPFTLPSVERLRSVALLSGVRNRKRVIVYDRNGGAWAARIWWLLRVHGFASVSVLDGGFRAWTGPVETGIPAPLSEVGELTLHSPSEQATADLDEVARAEPGTLVCALRAEQFAAEHIPGSVNVPYLALLRDDGTIDLDRARSSAVEASSIVYCGGGINAAGLILALVAAGLPAPRLFDGSLNAWRAR